ncbi:MAG: DUF962 domain-containing protein [Proteobacteria bacterium]|nr:DUF962 domain-containing protein [Pseudomonadota bacterium]
MQIATAVRDEYRENHVHPVNEVIHWICVLVIVWTVASLATLMLVLEIM